MLILAKSVLSLMIGFLATLFLGVVISNTLISTIQEIRAKKIVDKLSISDIE